MRRFFRRLASLGISTGSRDKSTVQLHEESPALSNSLDQNIRLLQERLAPNSDIVYRRFSVRGRDRIETVLIQVSGMTDTDTINTQVLRTLMLQSHQAQQSAGLTKSNAFKVARETIVSVAGVRDVNDFDDVLLEILTGTPILMFDGTPLALAIDATKWEQRGVEEPQTQSIVRGPRDGFCESLQVNAVLIRRRIKDPRLHFDMRKVGKRTKTDVAIAYIQDIANPQVVRDVSERLDKIDIDGILESGYIEQLIESNTWTLFPTIQETERPDQVAGALLSGRVAILVDTTPFVLLVPATLPMFLTSPEDTYFRWQLATALRLLRYGASFLALILPSLYVALTSFHPGMIPTNLAITIAGTREGVPFPAFVEAFVMEITFEMLREAGIRLPAPIGQTIGVVGAIIIGDAAVRAGLVSPIMVIVVAATAIANFVIPSYGLSATFRLIRFGLLMLSTMAGLFGIVLGLLFIIGHMSMLKSFDVPYLAPFAPLRYQDWGDTWFRAPLRSLPRRPTFLNPVDQSRMPKRTEQKRDQEPRRGRSGS